VTLAQLIPILLQISIGAVVLALGMRTAPGDITHLIHRPSQLVRSLLAMLVIMPLFVVAVAAVFDLRPEVELALLLLAVSPVPPVLPGKEAKAGGDFSYAIGLLAVSATVAIVTAPLTVQGVVSVFGRVVRVPMAVVGITIAKTVFVPLLTGVAFRRWLPGFARRAAGPLSTGGLILLVLLFIPMIAASWHAIVAQAADRSMLAIAAFILAGIGVGHVLGGPDDDERTVLALSTASRHPGVALAIAGAILPGQRAVTAVILLSLLVGAIVTGPYVKWRKRTAQPIPAA
jgi:BASS family bile acid:Na+ symporter